MSKTKTIGFIGMDPAGEQALAEAFNQARVQVPGWELVPEDEAEVVVVDLDTIYGHMAWLRLVNSTRTIVALSNKRSGESEHVLVKPVEARALVGLLQDLGEGRRDAEPRPQPETGPAPVQPAAAASSSQQAPTPEPAVSVSAADPDPLPEPEPEPPPPPRDPVLADYLQPGALPGPVLLEIQGAPALVLDPQRQEYVGGSSLKPFVPYGQRVIQREDWHAITPAELEKRRAESGAQPWSRLQWLSALVGGKGRIAEGYDPHQRYRLAKWPQTEREFPKHFRIATAMMKQPATLTEIAEASGVPLAEVTDFVNANLATGFAEMEVPPPPPETGTTNRGGLLGRLRGARGP
ncbi:MAG TPA: hypothetical protein VFG21_00785 [Xanthomonadaceae bacterium]|nr:hypothetical protein [Xanthomonadaceae bacterium]